MKKKKKVYSQTSKRFFWNLQQITEVTRCSCWHQNFIPKGLSAPALGLHVYTCIKSWKKKNCIKSDFKEIFLKLVANDGSDKRFPLTSKFCPLVVSGPDLQLNTFIKSWKDVYKVRDWRDSFKLATNGHSDKAFLLISKFWPEWVVCPYPRAMFKLLFLNNRWFEHILSTQMSNTGPVVLWFPCIRQTLLPKYEQNWLWKYFVWNMFEFCRYKYRQTRINFLWYFVYIDWNT